MNLATQYLTQPGWNDLCPQAPCPWEPSHRVSNLLVSPTVPHLPPPWLKPSARLPATLTQPPSSVSSNPRTTFLIQLLHTFPVTPYSLTTLAMPLSQIHCPTPDKNLLTLPYVTALKALLTISSGPSALCRTLNSIQLFLHKAFFELKNICHEVHVASTERTQDWRIHHSIR